MEAKRFNFRDIVGEAGALIGHNLAFLGGVTALVAVGYIALDLLTGSDNASSVPSIIVSVFVQYLVIERLLAHRMSDTSNRRYGALFLAGLLGGLGMIVGFIFLVVPGLVLAAGWSALTPFIVVERKGPIEALGASWRSTAASRWQIVLVLLATYTPVLIAFGGALAMFGVAEGAGGLEGEGLEGPAAVVAINFLVSVLGTWGWVLGAAVYNLAAPSNAMLEDVFG